MQKLILWLYSSHENKNGRSPLGFTKKMITISFFFTLLFCVLSGDMVMLGLYKLGKVQLRKSELEVNITSDTSITKKVEAFRGQKIGALENEDTYRDLFKGNKITYNSFLQFLKQQNISVLKMEERILGAYSILPYFTLDLESTIDICKGLGFHQPQPQLLKRASTEDIEFYVVFKILDEFRNQLKHDYGNPIRLIICFSGIIQWLTYISAVFGIVLLLLRIKMTKIQKQLILDGKFKNDVNLSLWAQDSVTTSHPLADLNYRYPGMLLLVHIINAVKHTFKKSLSFDEQKNLIRDEVTTLRNKTDADYILTDYLGYVSPSLGFLGTIIGIILAFSFTKALLGSSDTFERLLAFDNITAALSTAFDTTAIGLIWSLILNYLSSISKSSEANLFETLEKISITHLKIL